MKNSETKKAYWSIEKKYWTINEVAEMINVNASTIRFWESQFDWLEPKRNRRGKRKYLKENIDNVKSINLLVHVLGMTIEGVLRAYSAGYNKDLEQITREIL